MDRTKEFFSIVQIEKNQFFEPIQINTEKPKKDDIPQKTPNEIITHSGVSKKVSHITQRIFKVSTYLEKLKALVRSQSPFEENNNGIQRYIVMISEETRNLEFDITSTRSKLQFKSKQRNKHFEEIINSLESILTFSKRMFQKIIKRRSKQLKKQKKRRKKFLTERRYFDSTDDLVSPVKSMDNLLIHSSPDRVKNENITSLIERNDELEREKRLQEQALLERQDVNDRTEEVLKISKDIKQLHEMLTKLAQMSLKHKELTQRIDDNVCDAEENVVKGGKELIKYHNTISSNRGLILKVFAILILFVVFIGIFVIK